MKDKKLKNSVQSTEMISGSPKQADKCAEISKLSKQTWNKKRKSQESSKEDKTVSKRPKIEIVAGDEIVNRKTDEIGVKKKKRRYRGKKKSGGKSNPARLPSSTKEASSNWEKLKLEIARPNPKKTFKKFANKNQPKSENLVENTFVTKKNEIWFDDVDEELLEPEDRPSLSKEDIAKTNVETSDGLVKEKGFKGLTKVIGIDCEMVGVGYHGEESILARISLVNHFGHCIYDKFVKPGQKVTDYRTTVSGIRPKDIENGHDFKEVQKEVSDILLGRILVGHSLKHDLKVLFLDHPKKMIRDTSLYKPFRDAFGGRTPSLKNLSERMLGVKVQTGEHSSVQDAQAAVRLYTMCRKEWEKGLEEKRQSKNNVNIQGNRKAASNEKYKQNIVSNCPKYQDSDEEN